MSDEDIIKRRLLIDGDGTGDDRRLNMLLKQFLKWTFSKNDSPENNQIIYDRLLAQLAQCEFAAAKTEYTSKMIEQELKNYGKLSESIEKSIELARQEIEDSKRELVTAKEIRKNKMEYDMLAKVIKEQPDRKETTKQIEVLKKELSELMEKKIKLERKFQKRRNNFTLLMYSIRELESQLEEDSSSESEDDKSDDAVDSGSGGITKCAERRRIVELSDDDDDDEDDATTSTKGGKKRLAKESEKEMAAKQEIDLELKMDEDEPIQPMSEDAVLELSIEKYDNDVVKMEEGSVVL